ncbi:hypothetical protein FISHEDRAFT_73435 [Fistulina hepatica ATCC 64428]|uniref:Uncharacterized protein n=1 Tax=Fistulina hepatica ATCC 64428 TaxID=1128425 RepID=A0A0D7ACC4_9AGAR|nr:hypothetical protein FISHEDRAFT_73435 [Fistulina hepatica ATCC 64428]
MFYQKLIVLAAVVVGALAVAIETPTPVQVDAREAEETVYTAERIVYSDVPYYPYVILVTETVVWTAEPAAST